MAQKINVEQKVAENWAPYCTVMDHIFLSHGHRISQWNFDILSPPMLQEYTDVIHAKGAPLNNRSFPSSCLAPLQSEAECEAFVMKISFHSYVK